MSDPTWLGRRLDAAVAAFNRNPWTTRRLRLLPRDDRDAYDEDGLLTNHSHLSFCDDPRFRTAYERAVRAVGHDYAVRWRAHTVLWAAQLAVTRPGAFVECGTGRGFMMSAVCEYLNWRDRPLYLFDTFSPTVPDEQGVQRSDGVASPVYASSAEDVAQNFAEWPGVRLVVGSIPNTLDQEEIDEVAFLHVDMNHHVPEEAAIRHFWPRLCTGGAMVLDDYGFRGREPQAATFDRLATELGFAILALPTGQGLTIKSV